MKSRLLALVLLLVGCPRERGPDQTAVPTGPYALYTVQWGDSLWWIASAFDTPGGYKTLARLNGIRNPDVIWVGARLKIPVRSPQNVGLPPWPEPHPYRSALHACPTKPLAAPVPATVPGCVAAACVPFGSFEQVCGCSSKDEAVGSLLYVRNGMIAGKLEVAMTSTPVEDDWERLGTPMDFRIDEVQLDGDGPLEHVVGYRYSDMGAGLTNWQIWVIDGDTRFQPLSFVAGHWGPGSYVTTERNGQCDLLGTEWALADDAQHQSSGWNLVVRQYRFDAGALVPVAGGGVPTRRLLYSWQPTFVDVRGLPMGDVVGDFAGGRAFLRPYEPSLETDYVPYGSGVLTQVERVPAPLGGDALRMTWNADGMTLVQEPLTEGDQYAWRRLGDGRTGLLYPPSYLPAQPETLLRRSARLVHYGDQTYEPFNVLWLDAS